METTDKIRILFLSHYYPPEMGGASARISGLAKWLVKFGHDVSIITGLPNYPTGKIYPEYQNKKENVEYIDGVRIFRARVLPVSFQSVVVRLLNYFTLFITALWIGIRKKNDFDIIIATSPPLTIGILGLILSKLYKIPWILDIRDIHPDVAVEAGMLKENGYIHRKSKRLANYLYKNASYLTPVTERKLTKILNSGIPNHKISVVSNGVDFDIIRTAKPINWRVELNLENKFILIYAGLIGIAQGINVIVETANLLKEQDDIHFVIVGEGVEKLRIQNRVREFELSNVTFIPNQTKEAIPSLLTSSDIAIIPLVNNSLQDAVPSKLLEAWACELPVILIANGEAADIVKNACGGITVKNDDIESVSKAIIKLKNSQELMEKYANSGNKFVSTQFDRELLAKKMEKIIIQLLTE